MDEGIRKNLRLVLGVRWRLAIQNLQRSFVPPTLWCYVSVLPSSVAQSPSRACNQAGALIRWNLFHWYVFRYTPAWMDWGSNMAMDYYWKFCNTTQDKKRFGRVVSALRVLVFTEYHHFNFFKQYKKPSTYKKTSTYKQKEVYGSYWVVGLVYEGPL